MKRRILYLLLLSLLIGCSPVSKTEISDIDKISLQLKEENYKMNLSEIVDSIAYIPLETTEKSLLGDIDRMIVTEAGEYLIVDKEIASVLLLFTSEGKFVRQIGIKGDAPEEYIKIEDVAYYNRKVYIWDSANRKILEYNMNGELLNIYKSNYVAYSFSCIGERIFAFFCDYAHNPDLSYRGKLPNLLKYNANSDDWKMDLFFDENIPSQAYVSGLNCLSENILYSPMNDTIYEISSNDIKGKYVLDYSEIYKKNKKEYFAQFTNKNTTTHWDEKKDFPVLVTYFTCNSMNIFFIRSGKYLYYTFYFPELGITKEASAIGNPIINDIDNTASFFLRYAKDNILYSVLEPNILIDNNPILAKKIKIKSDDNLLIVKMFIKEERL